MNLPEDIQSQLTLRSRATGESVEQLVAQFIRQGLAAEKTNRSLYVSARWLWPGNIQSSGW